MLMDQTVTDNFNYFEGPEDIKRVSIKPALPSPEEDTCVDGVSWVEDCNTCYCVGGRVFCTEKNCTRGTSIVKC